MLPSGLDDSGAHIRAADVDRQDPAIFAENRLGCQVYTAHKARLLGMVAQRDQPGGDALRPHQHRGAADDEFADSAFAKAAADSDALRAAPFGRFEEAGGDHDEFASELLDRSNQDSGGIWIA
jgi:hypothetical protein